MTPRTSTASSPARCPGPTYSRHGNPTNEALEELVASLESGAGALACGSGMAALQLAITAALLDRRRVILAASALYGATINMLMKVLEPSGIETVFVDFCDEAAVAAAIAEHQARRAADGDHFESPAARRPARPYRGNGEGSRRALIVDSTFATPLIVRPLELGATFVVHSLTKYLAGHGDVLGGVVVTDEANIEPCALFRARSGPCSGPFEAYLAMRGIKTFPLRMQRQCANACRLASWLAIASRGRPRVFSRRSAAPGRGQHQTSVRARISTAPC